MNLYPTKSSPRQGNTIPPMADLDCADPSRQTTSVSSRKSAASGIPCREPLIIVSVMGRCRWSKKGFRRCATPCRSRCDMNDDHSQTGPSLGERCWWRVLYGLYCHLWVNSFQENLYPAHALKYLALFTRDIMNVKMLISAVQPAVVSMVYGHAMVTEPPLARETRTTTATPISVEDTSMKSTPIMSWLSKPEMCSTFTST